MRGEVVDAFGEGHGAAQALADTLQGPANHCAVLVGEQPVVFDHMRGDALEVYR